MSDINALIDEKIGTDADFQAELELLSDDERNQALADKRAELIATEFAEREEKARKAEEVARNQKIRAEKAEQELRKGVAKPAVATDDTKTSENLSLKDIRALQDVADEDVEEVVDFAKFKNISIAEARKHPAVQSLLKTREEERKTAEATSSGASRRAVSRNTGEDLLSKAERTGELPESEEDLQKLFLARQDRKRQQK